MLGAALALGIVHAAIDGACGFVLYRDLGTPDRGVASVAAWIIVYNTLALQVPLGLLCDRLRSYRGAVLGVAATLLALAVAPASPESAAVLAGLGNALYHVGAGAHVLLASGWPEPRRLGPAVNGDGETYFPSVTQSGVLYFTREAKDGTSAIYRSRSQDGDYATAERLPEAVNCGKTRYNAFVAPDESYVIVPVYGREDRLGGTDYYIVFRRAPDQWSEPQNLGPAINTPGSDEYSPSVSRDGRYFFFMSMREELPRIPATRRLSFDRLLAASRSAATRVPGLYWMDAGFIEDLRQRAVFH